MQIEFTAREIAERLSGLLIGDDSIVIRRLAKIEHAGPDELSFIANPKYAHFLEETRAGVVLIAPGLSRSSGTAIVIDDPYLAFVRLIELFHPTIMVESGIHKSAVIDPSARIGENVAIMANCFVGSNSFIGAKTILHPNVYVASRVTIGDACEIHANVSIRDGSKIGDHVIVQNNAVIGSDGFGFTPEGPHYRKVPQVGIVIIEDHVEIGAGTTIDRASLGQTTIGEGTKIDNLCQIAHNVTIGKHCVIAAQTGIAGSTSIGNNCMVGGQVGFIGHLKIGDGAKFGAQSGVSSDVADGEIVSGSPARPHMLWKRIEASLGRLPELFRRVKAIENRMGIDQDSITKEKV